MGKSVKRGSEIEIRRQKKTTTCKEIDNSIREGEAYAAT